MNLDRYTEKTALAARIVGTGALLTGLGLVLFGVGTYLTIAESYVFLGGVAWGTSLWESLSLSFTFAVLGIALVSACQVYLETGEVLSAPVIAAAALCIFAEAFFSTLSGGLSIRSFSLWIAAFSALSVSGYVWASSHIRTDILGVLFLILAAALIITGDSSPVSIVNAFSKARLLNQGVFLSWWYAEVARLVFRSGKSVSTISPIVDSVLPEGFRLAATWGKEVSSLGSSFTIRKLRSKPYTISELIKLGSLDSRMAAYLWMLLEMKGFVIISGVTATGKTTLLNSLSTVLDPGWKIVSLEDTREINLPHRGWKPLHSRESVSEAGGISLFDLSKLSLRERPDFVILGEARGAEVQALFQSAAAGTGCLATFHSPDPDSLTARLTQPPLSVAPTLLDLIDAVVFMVRDPKSAKRHVSGVVERSGGWRAVFKRRDDGWEGSPYESTRIFVKGSANGFSDRRVAVELEKRSVFLDRLVGKNVQDYPSLAEELRRFYASSSFTL